MADTKISALPAVAAELNADEFACNQAGVTKKETRAQIVSTITAAYNAHVAATAAGIHGSSVASANDLLVHRDGTGRAFVQDILTSAGAAADPSHSFTGDPNTGHYDYAADELGVATGGVHRAHWNPTGALILNDAAASSKMTGPGVTIQQGAYDDEAVAVQSTDVAHGMTDYADTDTFYSLQKVEVDAGGTALRGFKDGGGTPSGAFVVQGFLGENVDTTKTSAGRAIAEVQGFIKSGAGIGNTNADGNVFGVRTYRGGAYVTLLIVDEDADLHVLNDIVVTGVVDTIDVANHTHTGAAGMGAILANNIVTNAIIRDSAATSVIGRAGAGVGDPADIVAGVNDRLLAQTGGTVAFQQLTVGMVPGGTITATEIANRTRQFFVPCVGGWDSGTAAPLLRDHNAGYQLTDGNTCDAFGSFTVPNNFVSGMTVTPVVVPAANGNLRSTHDASYGQCTENYNIHFDFVALGTTAVLSGDNFCIQQLALTNEAVGDIVNLFFERVGGDILDTITAHVRFSGWIVEYTADS